MGTLPPSHPVDVPCFISAHTSDACLPPRAPHTCPCGLRMMPGVICATISATAPAKWRNTPNRPLSPLSMPPLTRGPRPRRASAARRWTSADLLRAGEAMLRMLAHDARQARLMRPLNHNRKLHPHSPGTAPFRAMFARYGEDRRKPDAVVPSHIADRERRRAAVCRRAGVDRFGVAGAARPTSACAPTAMPIRQAPCNAPSMRQRGTMCRYGCRRGATAVHRCGCPPG